MMRLKDGAGVVALAALMTACSATAGEGTHEATAESATQSLYVASDSVWSKLAIPVCWEDLADSTPEQRSWVRDQVARTWERHSNLRFTGWGECAFWESDGPIRIDVRDESSAPHTSGLGDSTSASFFVTMVLNMTFKNWGRECRTTQEHCVRAIAAHEFGHALGFAHEHHRQDTPASCTAEHSGTDGDTTVGAWDRDSIMNYCSSAWNNGGHPSPGDIRGLQQYYGSPAFRYLAKDAFNAGDGTLCMFNGGDYTVFDITENRARSGYPRPISRLATNWPAAWKSVDASLNLENGKVLLFRGGEVLKLDMARKRVDTGYPKNTASAIKNYPNTWRSAEDPTQTKLDAAVNWRNGKAYLFRGSEYVRYDIASQSIDPGFPKSIASGWPGAPTSDIEYVVRIDSDDYDDWIAHPSRAYFFKGKEFTRFDVARSRGDVGYPKLIVGRWPGIPF